MVTIKQAPPAPIHASEGPASESLAWQRSRNVPTPDPHDPRPENVLPSESLAGPDHVPKPEPGEQGGAPGPEPTRYGDWEKNGIAWDF